MLNIIYKFFFNSLCSKRVGFLHIRESLSFIENIQSGSAYGSVNHLVFIDLLGFGRLAFSYPKALRTMPLKPPAGFFKALFCLE
jgi:hypothetical protein